MIDNRKEFFAGGGMLAAFIAVLVLIFSPVFNGRNGLEYLDDLYNSISKGSAYYIPKLQEEISVLQGQQISVALTFDSEDQAGESARLFMKNGALVNVNGSSLKLTGDAGGILDGCLQDADAMYANDGGRLENRYGIDGRRVLFDWWTSLKRMEKALSQQKQFQTAKITAEVVKKAVENSYNYYGIEPQNISDRLGIVLFSLVFYVAYTLWYGFAVMFLFEGWGMQLGH